MTKTLTGQSVNVFGANAALTATISYTRPAGVTGTLRLANAPVTLEASVASSGGDKNVTIKYVP